LLQGALSNGSFNSSSSRVEFQRLEHIFR
jgi:hypothetical protein